MPKVTYSDSYKIEVVNHYQMCKLFKMTLDKTFASDQYTGSFPFFLPNVADSKVGSSSK